VIIAAAILDQLGATHYRSAVVDRRDPVGWRVRTQFRHEPVELDTIRGGAVTAGHGGKVLGLIQHAEVGERQTWIVADVATLDVLADPHGRLYASIEGPAIDGRLELRSVALVDATASVCVAPVRILSAAASVADSEEVDVLRLRTRDPHAAGLLERARAEVHDRRPGEPPRILDRRPRPVLHRFANDSAVPDGRLLPERGAGLWRSGASGHILSVR
jgi:hypothetical protein